MKQFFIYIEAGAACDYSPIGCGSRLVELPSGIKEADAIQWARDYVIESHYYDKEDNSRYEDPGIERVRVLTVSAEHDLDISAIEDTVDELEDSFQNRESEKRDRAEYERLRQKFEGKK